MNNVTLYAYLDISNPLVEWEVAIGRVCSSCDALRSEFGVSLWFYNNLKNKISDDKLIEVINEFHLESVRNEFYPDSVSRMRGVFFFESESMLNMAFTHWGKNYNPSYVSAVNFSASNITKVDSEWITQNLKLNNENREWMHSYWKGNSYWENPITEVLASGIGLVVNRDLRKLAYERILEREPHASKLLAFSAAKFFFGIENAGIAVPAITMEGTKIVGDYYIDMRSFENGEKPDMDEVLKYCRDKGAIFSYNNVCDTTGLQTIGNFNGRFEVESSEVQVAYTNAHGI